MTYKTMRNNKGQLTSQAHDDLQDTFRDLDGIFYNLIAKGYHPSEVVAEMHNDIAATLNLYYLSRRDK